MWTSPSLGMHAGSQAVPNEYYSALTIAGTRGPMDLMEVPSHVVERFANSPAVLKAFMPHQISGRAMGQAMVNDLQESQRIFEGLQLHQQVGSMTACAPCYRVHADTSIAPYVLCMLEIQGVISQGR